MIYDECDLLIKCSGIVENDVYEKGFYIILNVEKAYFGNR